jgi:hypothetical protein
MRHWCRRGGRGRGTNQVHEGRGGRRGPHQVPGCKVRENGRSGRRRLEQEQRRGGGLSPLGRLPLLTHVLGRLLFYYIHNQEQRAGGAPGAGRTWRPRCGRPRSRRPSGRAAGLRSCCCRPSGGGGGVHKGGGGGVMVLRPPACHVCAASTFKSSSTRLYKYVGTRWERVREGGLSCALAPF